MSNNTISVSKGELEQKIIVLQRTQEEMKRIMGKTDSTMGVLYGVTEVSAYSEIRKLEEIRRQGREIENLIDELQGDLRNAIRTMESTEQRMVDMMKLAAKSFGNIGAVGSRTASFIGKTSNTKAAKVTTSLMPNLNIAKVKAAVGNAKMAVNSNVKGLVSSIESTGKATCVKVKNVSSLMEAHIEKAASNAGKAVVSSVKSAAGRIESIDKEVGNCAKSAASKVKSYINWGEEKLAEFGKNVGKAAKKAIDAITSTIMKAVESLRNFANQLMKKMQSVTDNIEREIDAGIKKGKSLIDKIGKAVQVEKDKVKSFIELGAEKLNQFEKWVGKEATKIGDKICSITEKALEKLAELMKEAGAYIWKSIKYAFLGNWSKDGFTVLGMVLRIVLEAVVAVGLVVLTVLTGGAALPLDAAFLASGLLFGAQDLSYDIINWKTSGEHMLQTGLDLLSIIPLGKLAAVLKDKPAVKYLLKYTEKIKFGEAAESLLKKIDNIKFIKAAKTKIGELVGKAENAGSKLLNNGIQALYNKIEELVPVKIVYAQTPTGQTIPIFIKKSDYIKQAEENVVNKEVKDVKEVIEEVDKGGSKTTNGISEVGDDVPPAFRQNEFASSYEARINQTPGERNLDVGFTGARGESLCILKPPPDPEIQKILDAAGIDGIQYRNGVPDFSPVSKAQFEIEYMLGGKGDFGGKARTLNFAQADKKLADMLNNTPDMARQFGMEPGNIKASDISKYRDKYKFTWHELNDCKTIQLVPSKINNIFGHLGGVGEINADAFAPWGFATN